jgi:hypothetical protein
MSLVHFFREVCCAVINPSTEKFNFKTN